MQQYHKTSIATTKQTIKILKETNDADSLAKAYAHLANTYSHLNDQKKAQWYWKKGTQFIHPKTHPFIVASSHYTIGIILKAKNKFRLAQQAFINGIKACQELPNPGLLTDLYFNLSSTQLELHQFEKGKNNLEKAINYSDGSPYNTARLNELAANYAIQEGKYKEAKQKLLTALKLFKKILDDDQPDIHRVKLSLDRLKSGYVTEYHIQTQVNTFKEYINIFNELYKQTIDLFGSIQPVTTKHPTPGLYLHNYLFFCFTKCCKSFQAFAALINKGTPEDAMILLYAIYRNYLTITYLNNNPEQVFAFSNTENQNRPIYLTLQELVKLSPYPEDKIINNYLDKYLSDFAYSNFATSAYYHSKDETHYQYSAKDILSQAAQLGLYLQLLIIREIGTLINNDRWKNLVNKFIKEAIPLLMDSITLTLKEDKKLITAMKKRLTFL